MWGTRVDFGRDSLLMFEIWLFERAWCVSDDDMFSLFFRIDADEMLKLVARLFLPTC
jgi:hypothetical protein